MIGVRVKGGLGNHLFQVATAIATSKDQGLQLSIDTPSFSEEGTRHNVYWGSFIHLHDNVEGVSFETYHEPRFEYIPIPPLSKTHKTTLDGYFQSEKYFKHHRELIKRTFHISEDESKYLDEKYPHAGDYVAIHVRLGDYLQLKDCHPTPPKEYFERCITLLPNEKFYVFTDSPELVKEYLPFDDRFTIIQETKDYLELSLMTRCKHFICSNSSFSWWGQWLSDSPTKRVFLPYPWFGRKVSSNVKDIYPLNSNVVFY